MNQPDTPKPERKPEGGSRRSFLQLGALAAGAAALGPKALQAQDPPPPPQDPDGLAALVDVTYDLDRFQDVPIKAEPITGDEDIPITAVDFTQGLTAALNSVVELDEGIRAELLDHVTVLEEAVMAGDADFAIETLHLLRNAIECYTFEIDFAVGVVGFSESTSFSQTLIVMVDFLIRLRTRIIGVIYIFPAPQILKILEVFEEYKTCLTIIQIQQFEIYLRFWLFLLVIRFSFGWLGLRISIDILLIFISICLKVTIVDVFRFCITETRRQLLLVQC